MLLAPLRFVLHLLAPHADVDPIRSWFVATLWAREILNPDPSNLDTVYWPVLDFELIWLVENDQLQQLFTTFLHSIFSLLKRVVLWRGTSVYSRCDSCRLLKIQENLVSSSTHRPPIQIGSNFARLRIYMDLNFQFQF